MFSATAVQPLGSSLATSALCSSVPLAAIVFAQFSATASMLAFLARAESPSAARASLTNAYSESAGVADAGAATPATADAARSTVAVANASLLIRQRYKKHPGLSIFSPGPRLKEFLCSMPIRADVQAAG